MTMSDIEKHDQPVTVLLTVTAKRGLATEAFRRGVPVSTLLRVIVRDWMAEHAHPAGTPTTEENAR